MRPIHLFVVLVVVSALFVVAKGFEVNGYNLGRAGASPAQRRWWMDSASPFHVEGFVDSSKGKDKSPLLDHDQKKGDPIMEYGPGKPAPVDLYRPTPYHLLSDHLGQPRDQEALSCVNSRSCYAVDAEAYLSKVGNYRQLTNNYKREYPDDCSALRQELVLNFYKAEPISVSRG
jgi:hypothetical protein